MVASYQTAQGRVDGIQWELVEVTPVLPVNFPPADRVCSPSYLLESISLTFLKKRPSTLHGDRAARKNGNE